MDTAGEGSPHGRGSIHRLRGDAVGLANLEVVARALVDARVEGVQRAERDATLACERRAGVARGDSVVLAAGLGRAARNVARDGGLATTAGGWLGARGRARALLDADLLVDLRFI